MMNAAEINTASRLYLISVSKRKFLGFTRAAAVLCGTFEDSAEGHATIDAMLAEVYDKSHCYLRIVATSAKQALKIASKRA